MGVLVPALGRISYTIYITRVRLWRSHILNTLCEASLSLPEKVTGGQGCVSLFSYSPVRGFQAFAFVRGEKGDWTQHEVSVAILESHNTCIGVLAPTLSSTFRDGT